MANPLSSPVSDNSRPARSRRDIGVWIGLASLLATTIGIIPASISACSDLPACAGILGPDPGSDFKMTTEAAGHRAVKVKAEVPRAPQEGHQFWIIMEVHDVDPVDNPHSEFYGREQVSKGSPSPTLDLVEGADLSRRRTAKIYEVLDAVGNDLAIKLQLPDNTPGPDNFLLKEPCCAVTGAVEMPYRE